MWIHSKENHQISNKETNKNENRKMKKKQKTEKTKDNMIRKESDGTKREVPVAWWLPWCDVSQEIFGLSPSS